MKKMQVMVSMVGLLVVMLAAGCGKENPVAPHGVGVTAIDSSMTFEQFMQRRENIPSLTLDQFAAVTQATLQSNPSANRNEQVQLLWKALESAQRIQRDVSPNSADKVFGVLTNQETWLLVTNPWYVSMTTYATTEAQGRARSVWPNMNETLTRRDAFRHSYWNMLLAKFCSLDWANKFTTAHESESPSGNERTMDLVNNAYGRSLYQRYGVLYNDEYINLLRNQRYIYVTSFNQSFAGLVFLQW